MKIIWSRLALADRIEITDYMLREYREPAAKKQSDLIRYSIKMLADFPFSGRAGFIPGTYEKVCKGTPYIAVYEVKLTL